MKWEFTKLGSRASLYNRLDEETAEEIASTNDEKSLDFQTRRRKTVLSSRLPWIISTVGLAIFSVILLYRANTHRSFETGFATDLAAARPQVSVHQVRFTGSPFFTAEGDIYVAERPGEPRYVGKPSKEIDDNWAKILTKEPFFVLSEDEASEAWGPQYKGFWNENRGGYTAGFDMFHTLHCLNHIRQSFYPDYYPKHSYYGEVHLGHCIDHIRQMVQCYGDMTPIPSTYYTGLGHNYVITDQVHTCRKFEPLVRWTDERVNGSLVVDPKFRGNAS